MIQDILPDKLNNQYEVSAQINSRDKVIFIIDNKILINNKLYNQGQLAFPTREDIKSECEYRYLFEIDNNRYFLLWSNEPGNVNFSDDCEFAVLMDIRNKAVGPKFEMFAMFTAKHINDWYKDTCFCGRCGHKMIHSKTERAMTCPECNYTAYPRIMPAVIVGILDKENDKILVTRYKTGYAHNALVAGFTEIGETVEETVAREVMEEVGLKVKNIRYYKSQPWGIANDILLGYYCDVDGNNTISMDQNELKFAQWLSREELELQPDDFSLTNEMMYMFKSNKLC